MPPVTGVILAEIKLMRDERLMRDYCLTQSYGCSTHTHTVFMAIFQVNLDQLVAPLDSQSPAIPVLILKHPHSSG